MCLESEEPERSNTNDHNSKQIGKLPKVSFTFYIKKKGTIWGVLNKAKWCFFVSFPITQK